MAARKKKNEKNAPEEKPDDKPKTEPTKVEDFVRDLKCALTLEELATRADRAAQLVHQMDQEEEELKAYTKSIKSKIATLEAEHRELSSEVRVKYTFKEVDCQRHFVYAEKLVKEIRTDTGEEIDVRGMKNHELQKDLFDKDGGGDLDDEFDNSNDPDAPDDEPGPPEDSEE